MIICAYEEGADETVKKVIALLVSCCLVIAFNLAIAEVGFSQMTDEELLQAQEELQKEIVDRGLLKKITLPSGLFVAGVDIPAGKYIVTAATVNPARYAYIAIYKDMESASSILSSISTIFEQILPDYGSCMITLEEGQVLMLESVNFTIEKYNIASL